MPGLTVLGTPSKTTFLIVQNEKISIEFAAFEAIKKGQPVRIHTDGTVRVWAQADLLPTLVGYAYSDVAVNELVTVITRGFTVINVLSNAAMNAGLGGYLSYDSATDIGGTVGYSKYVVPAATTANAWILDVATAANQIVRALTVD